MDVSKNVEIFALVGIRMTIAPLSSPWPNPTRFAIWPPKFRVGLNNKRTCLAFTGILFLSQVTSMETKRSFEIICIDYVLAESALL